jgi:hypothetical protein
MGAFFKSLGRKIIHCKKDRSILMKGCERPLTFLKYNKDEDVFFSCVKDHMPIV